MHVLARIWPFLLLLMACRQPEEIRQPVRTVNHGMTLAPKTEKIILPPHTDSLFLLVENPHINRIQLQSTLHPTLIRTGDHFPFANRPVLHRLFFFPIPPATTPDTLTLSLDKTSENLHYTLRVLTEKEKHAYIQHDDRLIGLVTGFHLLGMILALILAVVTRSGKILVFSLYIFFALIWILNDAGLLFAHVWPEQPNAHKSSRGFLTSVTILLFGLYLSYNSHPHIRKGLSVMINGIFISLGIKFILAFVIANGSFPSPWIYPGLHINAIILTIIFGYIIVYLLKHGKNLKNEGYEVAGMIIYAFFVLYLSLRELGWTILPGMIIHQLESLYFFPMQCLFMFIHVYKNERDRTIQAEKELINFRIEQKQMTEKLLLEVEENEKKRIAQNIHDEIGSIFAAIKYQVFALKQKTNAQIQEQDLEQLLRLSDNGIQKQYSIIDDILIDSQQSSNFEELLHKHIRLFIGTSPVKTDIIIQIKEENWSKRSKAQVFRILSELLSNTLKHSAANYIKISLSGDDSIHLTYMDNGKGFDPGINHTGNGLRNIRDRVHILQGKMELISNQSGTKFNCTFHVSNI